MFVSDNDNDRSLAKDCRGLHIVSRLIYGVETHVVKGGRQKKKKISLLGPLLGQLKFRSSIKIPLSLHNS